MANPKEAILELRDYGRCIVICSPDRRHTYLNEQYDQPPHEAEFDDLVSHWKSKNPGCLCIDF